MVGLDSLQNVYLLQEMVMCHSQMELTHVQKKIKDQKFKIDEVRKKRKEVQN